MHFDHDRNAAVARRQDQPSVELDFPLPDERRVPYVEVHTKTGPALEGDPALISSAHLKLRVY